MPRYTDRQRGVYAGPALCGEPGSIAFDAVDQRGLVVARLTVPVGGEAEEEAVRVLYAFLDARCPEAPPQLVCEAGGNTGEPATHRGRPRSRPLMQLVH